MAFRGGKSNPAERTSMESQSGIVRQKACSQRLQNKVEPLASERSRTRHEGRAMRILTRLLDELYRVAAKYRCASLVVGAAALSPLSLGVSEPALAGTCTPLDADGNATCTAGTYTSNLNFGTNDTPINVTLEPGVIVNSPGGNAVNLANSTASEIFGADVTLTANNATITNINPAGANNTGLRIQSAGAATITASGGIDVAGTASDWAILAIIQGSNPATPKNITVTYGGGPGAPGLGLSSSPSGAESGGIQADNRGNGNASVTASGNVTVLSGPGQGVYGLLAHAGDPTFTGVAGAGDASVTYQSGTINVSGAPPRGILAWTDGNGSTTVTTDPGTTIDVTGGGRGVYLFSSSATAANGQSLTANVASTIMSSGGTNAIGIEAFSGADAPIVVNYTGPGIKTAGGSGDWHRWSVWQRQRQCNFNRPNHDKRLRRIRHSRRQRHDS